MKRETLEELTLPELHGLLVEDTLRLLEAMDKKADGVSIRDLKKKVELLQQVIEKRKAQESN